MAVVLTKSPNALGTADPTKARGRRIVCVDTVANLASDNSGSKYLIGMFPSECILTHDTIFKVDGWGYAAIRVGTFTDPAALVSVLKSAGATVKPIAQCDARHGKPLWQQLGLAADPGGEIGLYIHGIADATGAGTMLYEIHYLAR